MKKAFAWLMILSVFLFPQQAFAVGSGGFENASFSGRSLAESNAVVAQADEPAAISYNPAGITQLRGVQVQGNVHFLSLMARRTHNGDINQSTGMLSMVPTAYATFNPGRLLNDRLVLGIGTDSPFGLANKYNSNQSWVRYGGYLNSIKMFTIKPVAAIKFSDWFSVGGGPVFYRVFDLGTTMAYPNTALIQGLPDGELRAKLSGNTWGWQMGALIKPHPKHQLGFYFRSPVVAKMRGHVEVERAFVGGDFRTGAYGKLNLPMNLTFGYAHKPSDRTTIETDFGYTRWSIYRRLYINTDPVNANDDLLLSSIGKQDKDWADGFSLHLGGNHKVTKKLTLRAGSLFYWTPVPNDHFTASIPDANSLGFSFGASYEICKYLQLDLTYFDRLWLRRTIDNDFTESLGTTVDGRYVSHLSEFTTSLTFKWEELFSSKESRPKDNQSRPASRFQAIEDDLEKANISAPGSSPVRASKTQRAQGIK